MRLYAITNSQLFPGDANQRWRSLCEQSLSWVRRRVEFIQIREKLREKDRDGPDLQQERSLLVESTLEYADLYNLPRPKFLINVGDRRQVEAACETGAAGVHLPASGESLTRRVSEAGALWQSKRPWGGPPVISVSCHTVAEVDQAYREGVSVILFAPVFGKPIWESGEQRRRERGEPDPGLGPGREPVLDRVEARPHTVLAGVGLEALHAACMAGRTVPVFALGGVTVDNAAECTAAGAAGVAGIRLFHGEHWASLAEA